MIYFYLLASRIYLAEGGGASAGGSTSNDFAKLEDTLSGYYTNLIVPVGLTSAGLVIVYAGVLYTTSQGDPTKISLAKEYLFGAIIGLIILLSAGWIVGQVIG